MKTMAKKRSPKKNSSDYLPRAGTKSLADFDAQIAELDDMLGKYQAIRREFAESNLSEINVDGVQKFPTAIRFLKLYGAAVKYGVSRGSI